MDKITSTPEGQEYTLYYQRPVRSRNKRLWLCFLKEEDRWALSTSAYFPKSTDLGFRWAKRTEGVIMLNMVSGYSFGSDEMFAAIAKYNALFKRTAKN